MKKQYFFIQIFILFSTFCFSQTMNLGQGIPTFNGSNTNLSFDKKIQDIRDKTQLFISKKIGVDFVKKILKPGDSIEFSYEYVIGVNGHPIPNKTKVNTQYEFFNNKIQRIINILPEFQPAVAIRTKEPYPYQISYNSEFYVNEAYSFIPIYRKEIPQGLNISAEDKNIKHQKDNVVYFSTNFDKEITDIRTSSNQQSTIDLLTHKIKNLDSLCPSIYSELIRNENYSVNVRIYKPSKNPLLKFETPDKVAIYEGCERKNNNDAIKKCTSEKISKFVNKNFDTHLAGNLGLSGRQKILVAFTIDTNGETTNIRVRAHHPALQKEAERVIKDLPKFTPAIKDGKFIPSIYSIPIIFRVEEVNNRPIGGYPSSKNRHHNHQH